MARPVRRLRMERYSGLSQRRKATLSTRLERLLLTLALILSAGCSSDVKPPGVPPPPAPSQVAPRKGIPIRIDAPPGVPEAYRWLYDHSLTREAADAERRALPFTAVSLARTGCFGTCPVYTVTIRNDGTATYMGERGVPRVGKFTGQIAVAAFGQLSLMVERAGFMDLDERYAAPWTDDETIITTVTPRIGSPKSVLNYGRFGPPELWALERTIIGLVEDVGWVEAVKGQQ